VNPVADFAILRAHWSGARAGLLQAWRDAKELVTHRRLRVDTSAMTPDGMAVVLRTRLRLIGDTQTDVLRGWLTTASPQAIELTSAAHFQSVAAALRGWTAVRSIHRVSMYFAWTFTGCYSLWALWRTPWANLFDALLTTRSLWVGPLVASTMLLLRPLLRWRLRVWFRRGLAASSA
jgi:hypothetical protein